MATAVTGPDRLETMSRSQASSRRWMCASTLPTATAAKSTAVSATVTAVMAMSRPGAATSRCSGRPAAAGRLTPGMPHPARTAPGPRSPHVIHEPGPVHEGHCAVDRDSEEGGLCRARSGTGRWRSHQGTCRSAVR